MAGLPQNYNVDECWHMLSVIYSRYAVFMYVHSMCCNTDRAADGLEFINNTRDFFGDEFVDGTIRRLNINQDDVSISDVYNFMIDITEFLKELITYKIKA